MNKLMYSVWFKHPFTPRPEIEGTLEDYLNTILERIYFWQKNTQSL